MNRQLSFSPKLMTRSFDLELTSRLNLLVAMMYSINSWHSALSLEMRAALNSGSLTNVSEAATWSLQTSRMSPAACSISSCCFSSELMGVAMFFNLLKTASSLDDEHNR